ncbi:hypothetical protein GCK72_000840 [Caenorhabditis remanei]|uniref:Uncharacterized protein n=1 Tax=Caenorhabditis remanei TaxID=31234 RepID=A0A6A5HRR0_CAERE|nr:hypothetical protein GCK72_000840 [Caenorhabditis remanei]KAF1769027.1 hypothetical protein GCK72_000840 [Caenorhabditis remanei]
MVSDSVAKYAFNFLRELEYSEEDSGLLLEFQAKRKQNRPVTGTTSQTKLAQTNGESPKTDGTPVTPGKTETPNKEEDDDEEVKFNINIKKQEEKRDEFDDDEENPLAKINVKAKKNAGKKGGAGKNPGQAKNAEKAKVKTKEEIVGSERPFLAPNEKQYGVSCYQFEPSQSQEPAPPPVPKKVAQQKSFDGNRGAGNQTRTVVTAPTAPSAPTAPTQPSATTGPAQTKSILPSVLPTIETNTKSTISLTTKKKPKASEQERTSNEALEKTQKGEGEKI